MFLLERLKWSTIHRLVVERRLLTTRKYLDGSRFIINGIFEQRTQDKTRSSQRQRAKNEKHSLTLNVNAHQKNKLEEKMAISKTIAAWNALSEEVVTIRFPQYKEKIKSDQIYQQLLECGIAEHFNDL
jgi:TPP-dependent trihydroxycyclohexane-1,2-dione (THcHDO) dehydratase